jgi:foldase protein PrsA
VACCAALVTAVAVGACGSGVPSNAAVTVGNAKVLKVQVAHWLTVAQDTNYVGTNTAPPPVPLPPDYTACVASMRKGAAPGVTNATLKADCRGSYNSLIQTVVQFLVEGIWIQGEAYDRDVHVTNAQVVKAFNTERAQEFPTTAKFNTFLAEAGTTVPDLEWRIRLALLQQAIVNKIKAQTAAVTSAQIAAFYNSHLPEFTQPERRNVEFVLVASAATAATVKSLLAGGASYATVAKRYSIDPTTKDSGGVTDGVEAGEETPLFSAAIFKASTGVLGGPVKTPFGYYVFTVTKSTPGHSESLASERSSIKSQVASAADQKALTQLQDTFVPKWKKRTQCATGYVVLAICANAAPAKSTGATGEGATSGAT